MGRRDFQSTVAEVLPKIIENEASKAIGALHFFKKDKKTRGKLYFRGGFIYAIELTTYKPNVVNRIVTNEHIREGYREKILERFGRTLDNWDVVPFVLQGQLFPERPLLGYIKDYFLDAFDELYSWTEVNAEFKVNEEPSSNVPHVPSASPLEIIEKAKLRRRMIETEIAQPWNTPVSQLDNLRFRQNIADAPDGDYSTQLLLTIADGKMTIGDATEYLGWSRYNMKRDLFLLWQKGYIDILHQKGLIITNRTPDEIQARKVASKPATTVPAQATVVAVVAEPVATPVVVTPEPAKEEPVVMPEPVSEPVTAPTVSQPAPVVQPTNTMPVASTAPVAPITEPTVAPQTISTPVITPVAGGATSRLAALAAQMKAELEAQEAELAQLKNQVESLGQRRTMIANEKEALESKLTIVNQRLADVTSDFAEAETAYNLAVQEHQATLEFLK